MMEKAVFGTIPGLLASTTDGGRRDGADAGDPRTRFAELFARGGIEAGVWTCTAGGWTIDDRPDTEVVSILSGRARITNADGTSTEVGPGDVFVLPAGWSGRWDILEDLEKLYVTIEQDRR
jgi:uncharacterized cupin superfamily protein